jgi:ribosomal protein S18 acetylase RimI-like enzyme
MLAEHVTYPKQADMSSDLSVTLADATLPASFWQQIAHLHRQEIQGGFLSRMSPAFLEFLYSSVTRTDQAFLLAATVVGTGEVAGFICASMDTMKTLKQCVWQSGFGLMLGLLPRVLSWRTIRRLSETVCYANKDFGVLPRAEILNFCVDRKVQRRGIGRILFTSLRTELKRRGIASIKIVTGEAQTGAQRFYESVNARRAGTVEVHRGNKSVIFLYDIR